MQCTNNERIYWYLPWNQSNLYFPGVGSFAPKSTGDYAIHISRDEKPIKGSPFHIKVGDKELAHASKVKVSGPTTKAKANEPNILELDCSDAGRTKKSPALRYNNQWNFSKTCSENMLFYVISAFDWNSITFFSLIAMKLSLAQDMAAWVSSLKDHIARRLNANTMKTESIRFHTVHMNPASTS